MSAIIEVLVFFVEHCTGVTMTSHYDTVNASSRRPEELYEPLFDGYSVNDHERHLEDFTKFDPDDTIFQEFEAPEHQEALPKAWRQSLPSLKMSFWQCFRSVLLIQIVTGTLIGFLTVLLVFLDFSTSEWCYDENSKWNSMPKSVQHFRVIAQSVEGFLLQMWDFMCCVVTVFPFSLVKDLNLLTINLSAAFVDVIYRLCLQLYGYYKSSWLSYPLNGLFTFVILVNNFRLARHFHPRSFKNASKLTFTLCVQFCLGAPPLWILVYVVLPWYVKQDKLIKILVGGLCPLATVIPKVASRLGVQTLDGIIHPGCAYVPVIVIYGAAAVIFRVLQAESKSFGLFVALGVVHAVIDLLERVTIAMRDQFWEYLYRLIRRQRSRVQKYRSPRSRRLYADVSIQIMLQESSSLVFALGVFLAYSFTLIENKSFSGYGLLLIPFLQRAAIGLSIDLFFNTISLVIQTRITNVAVNRVWNKKWRYHTIVHACVMFFSVLYCSEYLFRVVKNEYDYRDAEAQPQNCTFPSFL